MRGKFIVVDGPDGSGKTTIIDRIQKRLSEKAIPVESLHFMDGPLGKNIRQNLFHSIDRPAVSKEALCMAAAINEICYDVIAPCLQRGVNVLLDRFTMSYFAYQVRAQNIEVAKVLYTYAEAWTPFQPDLYLFCDVDTDVAFQRSILRGHPSYMDLETKAFREKVLSAYRDHFFLHHHTAKARIDCNVSLSEVTEAVNKVVDDFFQLNQGNSV